MAITSTRRSHWETTDRIAAPVAALLLVSLLIMGTSRAAFFDTTENAANDFAAGTVAKPIAVVAAVEAQVGARAPGAVASGLHRLADDVSDVREIANPVDGLLSDHFQFR